MSELKAKRLKIIKKKDELLDEIVQAKQEADHRIALAKEGIDALQEEANGLCGDFKGKAIREVSDNTWKIFIAKRDRLGTSFNHNGIISRCADMMNADTGIFPPFCIEIARVLSGQDINEIGLSEDEIQVMNNFITLHPEGFKQEKEDGVIQEEEKDTETRASEDGEDKSITPKKPRKTRSDKGKSKASGTEES